MKIKNVLLITLACILIASYVYADPITYGFYGITHTLPANEAIGEAQLFVALSQDLSGNTVFHFYNNGPSPSSITEVYFDDGAIIGSTMSVIGDPLPSSPPPAGVDFNQGPPPNNPNLPGGNPIGFVVSDSYFATSNTPTQPYGVNPGEHLYITFVLASGKTFQDVLDDLESADLRIGIHVQGIGQNSGSESFVNNPTPILPIPEPATMIFLGGGLLGMAGFLRKKFKK